MLRMLASSVCVVSSTCSLYVVCVALWFMSGVPSGDDSYGPKHVKAVKQIGSYILHWVVLLLRSLLTRL
jgi:hypothetical protein